MPLARPLSCLLLLSLWGCTSSAGDDDDSTPADDDSTPADDDSTSSDGVSLDVGDVVDVEVASGGISTRVEEEGSYLLVLYSASDVPGISYGYGEMAETSPLLHPSDPLPSRPQVRSSVAAAVEPGETREFRVWNGTLMVTVTGEVILVTDGMVIYEDITTENPLGSLDMEVINEAVEDFEGIVMPRERQVFGEEPDVEDSGRIDMLISYTVNQYGVQAYVSGCDIASFTGCGASGNGSEVIYLSVPDPGDVYSSANAFEETMAHEINHLIYSWHKFVENDQLSASENIYLTEGMSALAQDLTGYNNGNQYVWWAAVDASKYYGSEVYSVQSLSVNDVLAGDGYYDSQRDGPLRGGAYLFLRYLFEQMGGMDVDTDSGAFTDSGGVAWLHAFFDTPELGAQAVESTTGWDLHDIALDFYTCLGVDGRGISTDPRWNFEERVTDPLTGYDFGVDMFGSFHGWVEMTGPLLQPLRQGDGELRSGGVEYLKTSLEAGEELTLAVDPESSPRARLIRLE